METQKPKSNSIITTVVDEAQMTITFNVLGAGSTVLKIADMNSYNITRAQFHGMKQRIADAAAIPRNTETGASATPQEKLDAMRELVEHYNSGAAEWSPKRSEGGGDSGGLLAQALGLMDPSKSQERIAEFLKGLDRKQKAQLLNSPKVLPFANEIRSRAGKGIDAEAMLAGL